MDFAWILDYTLMYIIKDSGKTIVKYDYDLKNHEISINYLFTILHFSETRIIFRQ